MAKKIFNKFRKNLDYAVSVVHWLFFGFGKRIGEDLNEIGIKMKHLINHRRPMLIVDKLERLSNSYIEVSALVTSDMPFVDENGVLDAAAYMELMAQSPGPLVSLDENGYACQVKEAYLAGARGIKVLGVAGVGDLLTIALSRKESYGNIFVLEGAVKRGDEYLVRGEITVCVKK